MYSLFEESAAPLRLPALPGYAQHGDETAGLLRVTVPGGELLYAPRFFSAPESDALLETLLASDSHDWRRTDWRATDPATVAWRQVRWQRESIRLYGRWVPVPRFTAWYADAGCAYSYSGVRHEPEAWTDVLRQIKNRIEPEAGTAFNSVLLNWYRDGQDSMGWHADDEAALGRDPVIASVNFGATRRFLLRRRDDHAQKLELPLHHGTLLVMRGALQHHWQHAVPKEARVRGHRVNLTFRVIRGLISRKAR